MIYVVSDNQDCKILLITYDVEECKDFVYNWIERNKMWLALRTEESIEREVNNCMNQEGFALSVETYDKEIQQSKKYYSICLTSSELNNLNDSGYINIDGELGHISIFTESFLKKEKDKLFSSFKNG